MLGNVSKEDIISVVDNSHNLLIGPDYPHFDVDEDKVRTWFLELDNGRVANHSDELLKLLDDSLILLFP